MRIGIEAKWLFRGPPGGRRVVWNLVRSLGVVAGGDELHFFVDERSRDEPLPPGVSAHQVHHVWAGNNQLANLFVVPRAADRLGMDAVVYQNFVPPPGAARHARIAMIYDVIFETHPEFFTRRERLYFAPLRYLTRAADRVCTGSRSERTRLVRLGYADASRIDVVPNAADESFVPLAELAAPMVHAVLDLLRAPPRFVLYAGRLNARKNVATLVRAMASVRARDVVLLVAGAADATSDDLAAIAERAGVADRVRLLGPVSDEVLRVLYAAAEVYCFPSIDEGFGLGPLEAMAAGTPVVASNIPPVIEVCGDAAVFVNPMDPVRMGEALDQLLADASRRAALRDAGLRRARLFTWRESARLLLESVRAAASGRRASAA